MIFRLFRRDPRDRTIAALYGAIVAQARKPDFYLGYGAPDTAEGRFDMIVLHLALLCRRLGREGATDALAQSVNQGVFDMFCRDMDHNLREMGVSDLSVPKTMRKLGEAFYGRLDTYDRALAQADDAELGAALARNTQGDGARLAGYVRAAATRLAALPIADLANARLSFPDPATLAAPACEAQA